MPKLITYLLVALGVALATPSDALGAHSGQHNVQIADAWAAQAAPAHINHCAGGTKLDRLSFHEDLGLASNGLRILGIAEGYVLNAERTEWVWDPTLCRIKMLSTLDPPMACWVYAHEVMHYVIGVEHVGPLDPSNPGAVDCFYSYTPPDLPIVTAPQVATAPQARKTARKKARRIMRRHIRAHRSLNTKLRHHR